MDRYQARYALAGLLCGTVLTGAAVDNPAVEEHSVVIEATHQAPKIDWLRATSIDNKTTGGVAQERRRLCARVFGTPESKTRVCLGYGPHPLPKGENTVKCYGVPQATTDACIDTGWLRCGTTYHWHVVALDQWWPRFTRSSFKACDE